MASKALEDFRAHLTLCTQCLNEVVWFGSWVMLNELHIGARLTVVEGLCAEGDRIVTEGAIINGQQNNCPQTMIDEARKDLAARIAARGATAPVAEEKKADA